MYHSKKTVLLAVGAFVLGCLLAILLKAPSTDPLTEPLVAFGQWLRNLSLSSSAGNIGAWAIVISLSCLPALGFLWKKRSKTELLLILSGAEIFAMLYYLVNPTRVSQVMKWIDGTTISKVWALMAFECVVGTLICWALLRFLKILVKKPADILPVFLFWTAVGYAFLLGFSGVHDIGTAIAKLSEGNTQENIVGASRTMIFVLHVLALIPNILGVWVIFLAGKLTLALEKEPFATETITLAERISGKTLLIAKASLLLTVLGNVLQLIWFPKLLQIHMEIHVPLLTLVLCAVLMLLCKYFRRAKEVSDDNTSII